MSSREARAKAARKLEQRVAAELSELAMEGASLEVRAGPSSRGVRSQRLGGGGAPRVHQPRNPASHRFATPRRAGSCRESCWRSPAWAPGAGAGTLAFDEIDAGIGGNTARAVGERLRRLGSERQVICITHLPQVASFAEAHFRIAKRASGGQATATVDRVDGDELVAEIVRMLGAERDDEAASRHARELLAAA